MAEAAVDKKPSTLDALALTVAKQAPLLRAKLNAVLRQTYGHAVSVNVAAASSLALLLSIVLYFLSPILEDDYHIYRQYLPWVYYLDWSQYDSFVVDHVVVFLSISVPMGWLFLINIANSSISTRVDAALLMLRVVCCITVCFSLTVILTEFLSRRVMIALISLSYGSGGLIYSWSVPIWRWYVEEASAKGLVAFMPDSIQRLLLRTSLLEWLTDTTFMDKMRPFLPFLLPLSKAEQSRVLEQLPVETQIMMTRPGMVSLLPPTVQKLLLPSVQDDETTMSSALVPVDTKGAIQHVSSAVPIPSTACAGFDFHRPTDSGPTSAADDVVSQIMSKRIMRGCVDLVRAPSSRTLNRTMATSTAILALQLYSSKGSRRMIVSLIQFAVASSLVSVASFAFVVRLLQLMMNSGQSASMLRYFRRYLIRTWVSAGQIAAHPAQHGTEHSKSTAKKVQTAATSVSAVIAILYVLRRMKR